jgi:hypothetical protein
MWFVARNHQHCYLSGLQVASKPTSQDDDESPLEFEA